MQDLIMLLLDAAIQVGGTLQCLERFAARCPEAAQTAADLAVAKQAMSDVRITLIRCADDLAAGPSPQ
ncbi:hypothetical protein ACWKSP_36540 [Micromonosporaceae bacterium Da 78-11]